MASTKLYISDSTGSDTQFPPYDPTSGSEQKPFKSQVGASSWLVEKRVKDLSKENDAELKSDDIMDGVEVLVWTIPKKEGGEESALAEGSYEPASSSYMKKFKKQLDTSIKKRSKALLEGSKKAAEELKRHQEREKLLAEAKDYSLTNPEDSEGFKEEDKSRRVKIKELVRGDDGGELKGKRVKVFAWVHRLRQQKGMTFLVLRDGSGYLQVILTALLATSPPALTLTEETSLCITGPLTPVPPQQNAPGGVEVVADWFKIIGRGEVGGVTARVNQDSNPDILADLRHLTLRGQTASSVMKLRAELLKSFRKVFDQLGLTEVLPPCLVQTQVEGGATLFSLDYYGQKAFLTQSSQLYLETCLPSLGDVYTVQESFRAESSNTRRHLSEFTHVEAELAFITFDDMLDHLEEVICRTVDDLLSDPVNETMLQTLWPSETPFVKPQRPFMRMNYRDAITFLRENHILNGEGKEHEPGEDIKEAAERKMTDMIGKPIMLCRFPKEIKAFYMQPCPEDPTLTESVDILMPGVGEIVGGSMRLWDHNELIEAYKREGIDPGPYYWYTDQRKYGTCEHGGYGLGLERFLAWLTNRYTVRECCLYPRWMDRATP